MIKEYVNRFVMKDKEIKHFIEQNLDKVDLFCYKDFAIKEDK